MNQARVVIGTDATSYKLCVRGTRGRVLHRHTPAGPCLLLYYC